MAHHSISLFMLISSTASLGCVARLTTHAVILRFVFSPNCDYPSNTTPKTYRERQMISSDITIDKESTENHVFEEL